MEESKSLWKIAAERIRPTVEKTPAAECFRLVCSYFEWADNNALAGTHKIKRSGGRERPDKMGTDDISKERPLTIIEMEAFTGISDWYQYKKTHAHQEGFATVFAFAEKVIKSNQLRGGLAGFYSQSLTARLNGLAENVNVNEPTTPQYLEIEKEDGDQF